jgi:hypothetical protein
MSRLLLAVPACFVLAACVSTNAVQLNPSVARAPVCPNAVQIFTSADRVGKPYVEIAVLNSKGESQWTDERKMFESQRNKAAKMGANGLIMDGIKEPSAGSKVAGAIFGTGTQRKGSATAIWIASDSARVSANCAGEHNRR